MELVSIKFKFNWIAPIYSIDAPPRENVQDAL